jgi:hypothetical protein
MNHKGEQYMENALSSGAVAYLLVSMHSHKRRSDPSRLCILGVDVLPRFLRRSLEEGDQLELFATRQIISRL